MNLQQLRGKAAIVGVGHAGIGEAPGFSAMEILGQAALAAVADAGLTLRDIDGLATCSSAASMWALPVAEYLGLRPQFIDSTMLGGSSFIAHLMPAMLALESGQCNAVLVCYGSTQKTGTFSRKAMSEAFRLPTACATASPSLSRWCRTSPCRWPMPATRSRRSTS